MKHFVLMNFFLTCYAVAFAVALLAYPVFLNKDSKQGNAEESHTKSLMRFA